jgi:hypothetical protein
MLKVFAHFSRFSNFQRKPCLQRHYTKQIEELLAKKGITLTDSEQAELAKFGTGKFSDLPQRDLDILEAELEKFDKDDLLTRDKPYTYVRVSFLSLFAIIMTLLYVVKREKLRGDLYESMVLENEQTLGSEILRLKAQREELKGYLTPEVIATIRKKDKGF